MSDIGPAADAITLVVPASVEQVRFLRLLASAVGDAADFDAEQIEDLRIAVDEVCVAVLDGGEPSGPLSVGFVGGSGSVTVTGHCPMVTGFTPPDLGGDSLQAQILAAVADDVAFGFDAGRATFTMRVRR